MKDRKENKKSGEAEENNDFFTPTPEKSPRLEKRNQYSENNTIPTYSVFRKATKIKPRDNIGLDFFH